MNCEICNHAVAVSSQKKGNATICHACRESSESVPISLIRLRDGTVELSLHADGNVGADHEVKQVIPVQLRKPALAALLDIRHREQGGDVDAEYLLQVITMMLPEVIVKALAA